MSNWSQRIHKRLLPLRLVERPRDLALLLQIGGFAFCVPLLMRLPLPKLRMLLEPRSPPAAADPERERKISELTVAVVQAGRPFLRVSCLTQGVTLYYFLRRAGSNVSLCFGMGRRQGEYGGHCWLVADGEPFMESRDPRPSYQEFYRFPEGPVAPAELSS